jgi:hypothetical protein
VWFGVDYLPEGCMEIREEIVVEDRDPTPSEVAKIMRQVSRVVTFMAGNLLHYAAQNNTPGAGLQVMQQILTVAANAELAAIGADPPRVAQAGGMPRMPGPGMPGGPMGRAQPS